MEFLGGTALMVAAIALMGFAKYANTRRQSSSWVRDFAGTEAVALIITTCSALGLALLFAGVASGPSGLGYTELAASIGCIVLAGFGVARLFRRAPVTGSVPAAPADAAPI